ncbi:hypothetical protein CERSUDRAFT_74603 [Gelatoporia subvermispora B]|uniref:Uncharacterized protein n=1 Tax=Ceriporiopsis subvermispora (strain B) TaxID=914234 RepID=M2RBI1_CERS8|nr:hypothetical protein CERSUDRAFT_74603 [Gelatoporia subvermispora B]
MRYFYGFVLDREAIVKRGIAEGVGHANTLVEREVTFVRTTRKMLREADLMSVCHLVSVLAIDGEQYWCVAVASNDPYETPYTHRDMPPQELVDKVKALLEKPDNVKPMWWKSKFNY